MQNIQWVDDPDGYIKIYKDVDKHTPYVIGGDTSGEGSDYFIGQILDNITGEQIAVLRHQMDEDLYTKQMYCLGKYFNYALVGIEANFSSFPIKELERLGYDNQYVRTREDTFTHSIVKSFGFKTTSTTRPVILAKLVQIVREEVEKINDKETLEEMLTFVRNEKGRPEAQEGAHDDLVMALAIAHHIREQQEMTQINVEKEEIIDFFASMRKETYRGDYGMEIKIIQEVTMEIVSLGAMILIIVAFYLGILIGQKIGKNENIKPIKVPIPKKENIPFTKEHKEMKEQAKEVERLNAILKNIDAYDGTGKGQRRID